MNSTPPLLNPQPAVPIVVRWVMLSLALLLLGVFAVRQSGQDIRQADAPVVWQKSLHFEDGERGEIVVIDAATRQQVAVFEGEQGFLRGTLRALVRERKKRAIGADEAFELSSHADGQMVLRDPATGEAIHLASFGPSNAQIYRQLQP
jgi:putative photosynthetic complex assembly protein